MTHEFTLNGVAKIVLAPKGDIEDLLIRKIFSKERVNVKYDYPNKGEVTIEEFLPKDEPLSSLPDTFASLATKTFNETFLIK